MTLLDSIMDQCIANDNAYDLLMNGEHGVVNLEYLTVHDLEVIGEHLQKQFDGIIQAMRAHEFQSFSLDS